MNKEAIASLNKEETAPNQIMPIRDTIFIGHANPEDNEFTLWLRSKLINEGYKVECDLTFLLGGENDYWKSLQELLESGTIKYLLVYSKNTFLKQGVIDEWEQAKAVGSDTGIQDFRIVCKIDDVSFSSRIGLNVMNQIRFDRSWSIGLKQVLRKLRRDQVPRGAKNNYSVDDWFKNRYTTEYNLKKKNESYYSNWFELPELPETLFIHEYDTPAQAKLIANEISSYPAFAHDKYLVTFLENVPTSGKEKIDELNGATKLIDIDIVARNKQCIPTRLYKDNHDSYPFPGNVDLKKFMVRLLRDAFFKFLNLKNVPFHEMSNKLRCFYYREGQIENNKVSYLYRGNWSRPKQILGDYFEHTWHYGISVKPILRPVLRFAIKGHLLFSDDGENIWEKKNELASARRSKGKGFYNADWRNLMLAFMHSIADDEGNISMALSDIFTVTISASPIIFHSTYGYVEPTSNARLVPVDSEFESFMEEEEMYDAEEIEDAEENNETNENDIEL